jgi:hypothetical protein
MRSEKEIMNLAENAGFRFEKKRPSMLGYECGKVGILAFLKIPEICSVTDKIFPLFHSAVIFKFSKPIVK